MNEKKLKPVCWMIEQFDFVTEQMMRRIVWTKPPENMGVEVKEIHFISEKNKAENDE